MSVTFLGIFGQIYTTPFLYSIFETECKKQDLEPFVSSFFDIKMAKVLRRCFLSVHPDKVARITDDHREAFAVLNDVLNWFNEHVRPILGENDAKRRACFLNLCLEAPHTHYGQLPFSPPVPAPEVAPIFRKRPAPASPPADTTPKPKSKRAKSGRSRNYHTNFLHYKQIWFKKVGGDPSHDFTEELAETIYLRWVRDYYNGSLGSFDALLMPKFRKLANAIETRINNLTRQRHVILGLRTGPAQAHLVTLH